MSVQAYEIREYGTGLRDHLYRRWSAARDDPRPRTATIAPWGRPIARRADVWPPARMHAHR